MRDRLIELLKSIPHGIATFGDVTENLYIENVMAEHLLENGVIVPPCKVGDTVYVVDKRLDVWWKGEVSSVGYVDQNNIQIGVIYDEGEVAICDADTVFLTKEEAEEALKGGVGNE